MHTHICTHAHLATLPTYLDTCTETMQSSTLIPHTHTQCYAHQLDSYFSFHGNIRCHLFAKLPKILNTWGNTAVMHVRAHTTK